MFKQNELPSTIVPMIKAGAMPKPLPKTKNKVHLYRVGYVPNGGKRTPAPAINLGGHWLAEFGFITGQQLIVSAKRGLIIIKAAENCAEAG
ncbi:SymE family type I addiction module toxin [Acerihabitans arboris]|uniref:Type I addiction module toxin, SymE family n=1 Tax=Acerihabitans arboris TaxID=2691583 RepID=A0A845SI30_9GAMM|nr:SymE family type I addiction module toxin [Acerihabitans arboris]NDL62318.1 type I addiction module toxin, SymE family [Acerihabitans arboris]